MSLLLLLFSSSSFAQEKLPVENKIYYDVVYLCHDEALLDKKLENVACEISTDRVFSIQKDSIIFSYKDRKGYVSIGKQREVYHPIASTNLTSNTTLYLLEDAKNYLNTF